MLDQEQIDNWDGISPDMQAALEYSRRYRKGLPTDRYTDGADGAMAVARGIEEITHALTNVWAAYLSLQRKETARGAEAMEAHADPMR